MIDLRFRPLVSMILLYKQQQGTLEALKAKSGYVGGYADNGGELKYLMESFEEAPPVQ